MLKIWKEIVDTPFSQFPVELQVATAVFVLGFIGLLVSILASLSRRTRERRRQPRCQLVSRVRVSWWDREGPRVLPDASCRDYSEAGLGLAHVPDRIRRGTKIGFEMSAIHFQGSGVVRHCSRTSSGYDVGIAITCRSPATLDRWASIRFEPSEAASGSQVR